MKEQLRILLDRYQALEPREQRVLALGAVVVLIALLYLAIWEPLVAMRHNARDSLDQARATAARLEALGAQIGGPRGGNAAALIGRDQSLLSVVDQAGKAGPFGKPLSRIQPDGDKTVRVWLEAVPFDALVRWINDLKTRYGITVTAAEIEAESAGVVNARLSLERM